MARPRKWRNVCALPNTNRFGPLDVFSHGPCIVMSVDEYETLRLIDHEGMTQEECAENMCIARTTVQRIYSDARKKIAESLVMGKVLKIEGGDYKLCDRRGPGCGRCGCNRHRFGKGNKGY